MRYISSVVDMSINKIVKFEEMRTQGQAWENKCLHNELQFGMAFGQGG